jgi:hypothetical protein
MSPCICAVALKKVYMFVFTDVSFYVRTSDEHQTVAVAVYCDNHMKHTNTLCGQNAEF